jgi:glycosyltransferase involved in cell wall biosynthesis
LEKFVFKSLDDLKKVSDDFEIILVNDGSTDKTLEISQGLCDSNSNLRLITLEKNSGVGIATKIGLKAASKEIIFNNTVDAFFNTKELPRFLESLNEFDVISGYRTNLRSNNWYGKALTVVNYYLIRVLFNPKLKAYQTVQFFKKEVLDKIEIESTSTFIAPELLIKANLLGYKIKELPTEYQKRLAGKGKCGTPKNIFRTIGNILKFWFLWRVLKRYQYEKKI